MIEYIFELDGALYDEETEQVVFKPTIKEELIRCKDCLFNDGDGPNEDGKYWCALHQSFMQYCSEAERKEK